VSFVAAACAAGAPEPELWSGNQAPLTRDLTISETGDLRLFCVMVGGFRYSTILVQTRPDAAAWSEPTVLPLARDPRWHYFEPHLAPGTSWLYYVTDQPHAGPDASGPQGEDIWRVRHAPIDRAVGRGVRWGEPEPLLAPINSDAAEFFPSLTRDGSLYFTRRMVDSRVEQILRARPDGQGGWREPEVLPAAINAGATRFNAFVDPDERYVIVCVAGHPENLGQVDYWIAFRGDDDTWRGPVNLGPVVNGPGREGWSPYVTPDGQWFYFMSKAARPDAVDQPLTAARLLALHARPGNGYGHLWRVPASYLWSLDPGDE
jgi:hypothetical protein